MKYSDWDCTNDSEALFVLNSTA